MKIAKFIKNMAYLLLVSAGFVISSFSSEDMFDEDMPDIKLKAPREIGTYSGPYKKQRMKDFIRLFKEVVLTTPRDKYTVSEAISKIVFKYDPYLGTIIYNPLSGIAKQVVSKPSAEQTRGILLDREKARIKREKDEELARSKQAGQFHKFIKEKEMKEQMEEQMEEQMKKEREVKVKDEE